MIGEKSEDLDPGYVFAPYLIVNSAFKNCFTTAVINDTYNLPQERMNKISKLFNFEAEIWHNTFNPRKSLTSRYAKKIINNSLYGIIETKRDTI